MREENYARWGIMRIIVWRQSIVFITSELYHFITNLSAYDPVAAIPAVQVFLDLYANFLPAFVAMALAPALAFA
jgi:hypothetical protein